MEHYLCTMPAGGGGIFAHYLAVRPQPGMGGNMDLSSGEQELICDSQDTIGLSKLFTAGSDQQEGDVGKPDVGVLVEIALPELATSKT